MSIKFSKMLLLFSSTVALATIPSFAYAAGGEINWLDFGLRITNVIIFLFIIYKAAGKKIGALLRSRGEKYVSDLDQLENEKKAAIDALADVEKRIANIEEECATLLAEGKEQAEQMAAGIVAEAEKQAQAIVDQARKSANQLVQNEIAQVRAKLADEIIVEVRKNLEQNLDEAKHYDLIDASLKRVSNF